MYKLPILQNFKTSREFFHEFYQINVPEISHRKFAEGIGWPVSLLGDIMQGRKNFSIARAVELGRFLNLNSVGQEYLFMLALNDVDHVGVKDYAQTFFKTEGTLMGNDPLAPSAYVFVESDEGYHERSYLSLYLQWTRGEMDFAKLKDLFPTVPKFQNEETVLGILQRMKDEGQIDSVTTPIRVLQPRTMQVNGTQTWMDELELVREILTKNPDNTSPSSGSLLFPTSKMTELRDRRNALVSWVLRTMEQNPVTETSVPEDHTILHMVLSIYEMLKVDIHRPTSVYQFDFRPAVTEVEPKIPKSEVPALENQISAEPV